MTLLIACILIAAFDMHEAMYVFAGIVWFLHLNFHSR